MLAMEAPGGGRDARFNLGYNMSMLGSDAPDMYNNRNSPLNQRSMLPSSCGGLPRGLKRTSSDVCFDQDRPMSSQPMSINTDLNSDLVDDGYTQVQQNKKTPPPNGKKTKGRVKIKMEYIDNKLRRYTTFSKRKTGIMKKAYELSTLTGTQVMLLVASETGHVYTFATRKLQPMITSEAGKALIQTCLNSPDPAPSSAGGDQRMSATGFEETELTYNISDEEQKEDGASDSDFDNSIGDGDSYQSGVDSPGPSDTKDFQKSGNGNSQSNEENTNIETSISGGFPGVMYQTPNGMVYATAPPTSLSNSVIFSLSPQVDGEAGTASPRSQPAGRQQFITIPFPLMSSKTETTEGAADLSKTRK